MSGSNKVNVVSALFLKFQENFCQTFYGNLFTEIVMTEGVILAKYAFQVQPEKKTVPLPLVPLMQGSSHGWRAARAIFNVLPA